MRAWLQKLPEYLVRLDPDYRLWWSQGLVLDRNVVCGPTDRHTVALKMGLVREHTFDKPISHAAIFTEGPLPASARRYALTDDDKKSSFKPAKILCSRKDTTLSRDIVDTIPVRSVRNTLLKKCEDSGLKLIPILLAKCDEIGPVANDLAATKLSALTKAGPTDRSVASFNHWREVYDTWNETQSNDAVIKDPLLSSRYVAAVRLCDA